MKTFIKKSLNSTQLKTIMGEAKQPRKIKASELVDIVGGGGKTLKCKPTH